MKFKLCLLVLNFICVYSMAQSSGTVIIRQTTHAYTLTSPDGWESDDKSARAMRIDMAFHPDTTKWTKASVVMYSNITHKTSAEQTLEEVIEMDAASFLKKSPGATKETTKELLTFPQKKRVIVVEFRNSELNNYESVAFIEEEFHVIMIVLGSRDADVHDKCLADFETLAQSYFNLAEE